MTRLRGPLRNQANQRHVGRASTTAPILDPTVREAARSIRKMAEQMARTSALRGRGERLDTRARGSARLPHGRISETHPLRPAFAAHQE
jgi:hypothetical protein